MSVIKLTKKDIIKKDDEDKKIKLNRNQISYDSALVSGWETDADESFGTLQKYREKLDKGEYLSSDDLNSYKSAMDRYIENSNRLRGLNKTLGKGFTEEEEKQWNDSVTSFQTNYDDVFNYYSKWKTEDEYNQWYESYKKSLEEAERLKELANSEQASKGWGKYITDESKATEEDQPKGFLEKMGYYLSQGTSDTTLPTVGETNAVVNAYRNDDSYKKPNDDWTEEQKNIFGALYLSDLKEAEKYAVTINNSINVAKEQEAIKKIQESATSNFWVGAGHTLGAIASSPFGLADYMDDLAKIAAGRPITSDGFVSPFEYSQAVTEGISTNLNEMSGTLNENIPIIGGKGLGDVYGLGTSIAQSLASAYTLGASGTLISYFGQGAASGVDDALSRGATEGQAVLYGTSLGVFEGLAEMVGIDNLFKLGSSATIKGFIKNILNQAGAEGAEEGLTSLFSNIADNVIMQDKSNFNTLVTQYMAQGMSESEAKKKAWMNAVEGIAFDTIAGAVSGGVSGSLHTSVANIIANKEASQLYGNGAELVTEAKEIGGEAGTLADKYQAKLDKGKSLSGGQINRLVEANENAMVSQDKAKMQTATETRLTELGENGDISSIAKVIIKQASGEKLTKSEKALLQNSKYGQRVVNEITPSNVGSGEYSNAWAENIGTERINTEAYNMGLYDLAREVVDGKPSTEASSTLPRTSVVSPQSFVPTETNSTPTEENAVESKFAVSESNETINTKTGEAVKVVGIESIKNGEMVLKVENSEGNAETISAKDVSFSSNDALIYSAVADMGASETATWNIVKNFKPSDGVSANVYAQDVAFAYKYGVLNYKQGLSNLDLTADQALVAFYQGRNDAEAKLKRNVNNPTTATAKNKTASKGKVIFEGFKYNEKKANPNQKASMAAINFIAEMSPLEVHVYESKRENGQFMAYINGKKRIAPNGYFIEGTNKIYIDINAGSNGEGLMLDTAGHEITHYIAEWNWEGFKELGDFLFEHYGADVPVNTLIENQKARIIESYKRDGKAMPSEDVLFQKAYEETVADAMSKMLADERAYVKLAELKQQNRTLWEKLGEAIKNLLNKIKSLIGTYSNEDFVSTDAKYVAEFSKDVYEKLQDLYLKAFVEANAKVELLADAKPISADEIITDGATVTDSDGKVYSIRSMKSDITDGQMFRDLMTHCGFTKEQVGTLRTQLEDLVEYMIPFRDIVDMNETYGREGRRFAPYKPNSDPLYTISLDFSTLCSKRLLTQYVIEQLQLREKRPMSAEEQMAIRDMLKEYAKIEKGLQVACVMCYVEAARLKSPKQIQKWLDDPATVMRNYFADQNPEFAAYIKKAQADFKESRGYARDASKSEMKEANKQNGAKDIRALNQLRPRLRAEYKPSAEEMKIIETAVALPKETFLTAGNLANLSEEHSEIYKAYTAFIRTATRSKSLETDEPYYYGDSTRDNGNRIVVSDSFIEAINKENGMRFSSWSDWRIQHLLDWITAVIDNSVRGAAMHGYTKYGDEVRVLGNTGMMFNMSGVPGTQTGLNEDGSLNFSDTESMDYKEAIALRKEFPETAGLQCIGVSKEHIFALLRSDVIDYVIPYHTSGLNATLRRMGDIYGWENFTNTQHATENKSIKKENAVDPDHWHQEPVFSEFFVGYNTGLGGVEAMQKSAENYIRMCEERGLTPKFVEFSKEPNYWKLLIDRKMVNTETNTLIEQKAVTPKFDFDVIKGIVDKYVKNYDAGLEERAFNHIVENWDSVPQRIKDLKKQGTAKAKSTKKAIDKLANEPLAVQPKGEIKPSERDLIVNADNVQTANEQIASDFTTHIKGIIKDKGGWYAKDIFKYVEEHPELNFVERIYQKDKTVKKDLEKFLSEVNDVKSLESLSWFMGEAYGDKDSTWSWAEGSKYPYRGAVRTFRNAVKKRINEIESEKVGGTNLGVKNGEISLEDTKKLFNELNTNKEIGELAEKVFNTAEMLGVNIRFANQTFAKGNVAGDAMGDMVEYKTSYFNDTAYSNQHKAKTILHELIHTCTVYVMHEDSKYNLMVNYHSINGKSDNYVKLRNASTRLNRIFAEIKNDPDFKGQYGLKNSQEMVAELANEEFVALLKKKTLWDRIIDAIAELFGFSRGNSAYDNVVQCLDYILDNPDIKEYKAYAIEQRKNARYDGRGVFGSTNYTDYYENVMYSERVSNKELASMDETALYIKNTKNANYIGMIFNGTKTEETRSRRTLDAFIGKDFYVTDGKYVYGSVVFGEPHKYTEEEFHKLENRKKHRVPKGDEYDIKPGGIKWAYPIESYKKFDKPKKLSDSKEYKNSFQAREVMYSERDPNASNRSILANSLESAAQNDIERNKLAQYKEKISLIEAEEQRLSEIQKQLFTKGGVEPENRKDLQFEAKQIANRINTYDRQLLNLESTTALKNVLNREKALAMKRQKQKDAEAMKKYKEKVAKTQRELLERNQESRKKAIESREKTAMRHKIKSVVNDLNTLLLKPTKERHVPEEMKIAVAEALTVVNMDTVSAEERVAKYNALIAKATDPDIIASLTATRDRILEQGDKMSDKLTKLKDAYGMVRDSTDDSVRSMYDDVIYSKIESVQRTVGKTPLRNMTLSQLESVYDLYRMVLTTIRDSNKAFAENLNMTRLALGSNTFAEIKETNKVRDTIKHPSLEKFIWQNLKPMQAMKTIGSETLQKLWNNILYGQEVFAVDYDEAVKFAKEMKEKHGYEKWNKDKLYSFASKSGKTMKLNLEQMMSIYAYSKRAQADEHIEYGGIVLNEGVIKVKNKLGKTVEVKVNDSTAYRLDKLQVAGIISALEKEFPGAKAFVDDMQKYLSETMGEKGNEVSMKMYGIKLFKEEHYFPLKSSKDFMEAANAKLKGDVKIKNKGMTKSTVEHARNPIVLENFLDVWGNHINEMAMYHGLVLPLEDFSRTLNYSFKADDSLNTDAESVRTALHDAFGESADNYLNELLKAINGGVLHDSSAEIADKMISKFKKAKVMASLSVIVQQPTAIIRAMGIIDPKYFVAQNFNHKATWEELKKYCPTAIIKETGSFDTNMGRTIVDMIKDERGFTDKVGDALGKAPAYMDEVGWNMIWRALKKKVAAEQKLSGEALLEECGKQMTLIINETQVYDSVMSRNELMRSKNALTKMATAFMAEPSTVANMVYGAALDFKRGKKGIAGKTVTAVITSVVINGLVSSLVYALRDDDEEKTWLEKYLSSATTEVVDGLNPLTYIPFVKDAYSLFQGYKVERTDMALIKDVVDAVDSFYKVLDPEAYEGMSREEIAKHIYENSVPLLTSICDMFGLPVGNVLRDAEAIIINDNIPMSQTSSSGIGYAFKEGLQGALPKIVEKVIGTDSKQDKLYDAIVSGDTAYIERLKSGYKDDKAYETAVRKALRENDPRIKEAAELRKNGEVTECFAIVDKIANEGHFKRTLVISAVNSELEKLKKAEK